MVFLNIASGSGNWCNDFENNLVRCTLKMSLLSITAFLGINNTELYTKIYI